MIWNRAHVILVLAASVALTACDAGPSLKSAAKRPLRDSRSLFDQANEGLTEQDKKNLATMGFNFDEQDDRLRTDPRRFRRTQTYQPQPNYQTVPEYGDYYVPDATYGQ